MRRAMAEAEVGDEQYGEDPTITRLCARVCDLLGAEDAVFLPSGTMANEIAILVHCRPGDEIVADASAHIVHFEAGGPAALAGAMIRPIAGKRGIFTAADLAAAIRPESRYAPRTRLVEVEQTANLGGGTVWPLDQLRAVVATAHAHGLALHMDGARLMNAVVASGVPAAEYARGFDTVWLDFSKGLGCPVGAVLAGKRQHIAEAWRWKQRIGGALRQAGILGAACLYALDHHVERLAQDHANARMLADGIAALPGVAVEPVDTNIVFFDVAGTGKTGDAIARELARRGVRMGAMTATRMRAVTHLDVPAAAIPEVISALADVLRGRGS
ncbi:MAG: threonine aldolase family protein [Alphaproteobacteria bacterium]|nr:threonine aldolase family protein [Alphaproteobacteria bacterium]